MKVIGRRSNICLFVYPVILALCIFVVYYFVGLYTDLHTAINNGDMQTAEQLEQILDKYTINHSFRRLRAILNPPGYVMYSVVFAAYSIYAFNRRLVQPRVLIEYDDKGFYLNMPYNKTWYVLYEEILCIDVRKNEDMVWLVKHNYRRTRRDWKGIPIDPDAYVNVKSSTFGLLKTGVIIVGLNDKTIKVRGVKNALEVAQQMQVVCNDGKRRRNEWLDDKKREKELKELEKREQELRERTKT